MILLLLLVGATYVAVVRFALRKQSARRRRLGVATSAVAWLVWVVVMAPWVDAMAEYTGAKFDRAVLFTAAVTLLLWGGAPLAAIKIAARASRKGQALP